MTEKNAIVRVLEPVDFHGQELVVIDREGEPYVAMKPVVEGMGMDWKGQHVKLRDGATRFCVEVISMQMPGDDQERDVTVVPLRKLPGWLMTLQPRRMKPEIAARVRLYQAECDDALWAYWSTGIVMNPRAVTSLTANEILLQAVQSLVDQERAVAELRGEHRQIVGRVDAIEQRHVTAERDLLALPEPVVVPDALSTRAKVVRAVRTYCRASEVPYPDAWGALYREYRDRYHLDLVTRARHEGCAPMDMAERLEEEGCPIFDDLYAVAHALFAPKP